MPKKRPAAATQKDDSPAAPVAPPSLPLGLREELDSSADLIFVAARNGRVAWISSVYERLTGLGRMPMIGQPFTKLGAGADFLEATSTFLERKPRSVLKLRDLPLAAAESRAPRVALRVRLVEDRPGEAFFVGVARQFDAEGVEPESLRERHLEVIARIIEARAGARVRTEFLRSMSDEIRVPMGDVMSMVQQLNETQLGEDQARLVEVIRSSTQSLLNLMNDTLEFSQLESSGLDLATRPFDLRIAADEVARQLGPIAHERGLAFEVRVGHDVPSRLKGDPGRLRQIMLNLAGSAIRFSERGEIAFHITRVEEGEDSVTLRFAVTHPVEADSSAALSELVEAYMRSGAPAETHLGAQLSFAIARRVVLMMGGEVGDEVAADGASNTMWFQLELEKQAERREEVVVTVSGRDQPAPVEGLEGMLVMVIDSSPTTRKSTVDSLKEWGCIPLEAENSALALIQLRKAAQANQAVRMALIDKELADGGTFELARVLRTDKKLARTLPLLIAGTGQRGDAAAAQAAGFRAYLAKPLQASELHDGLLAVLESARAGSAELVTRHSIAEARQSRVRVLVVEDSQVDLLVSQWALERQGYKVEVAATAAAALEACLHTRFAIVLLDLQLPDGNGYEVVAELRKREFESDSEHTPIVAITADINPATREKCLAAGMDDYLPKPVDLEALCSTVSHWLRPHDDAPAPATDPASAPAPAATEAPAPAPAEAPEPAAPAAAPTADDSLAALPSEPTALPNGPAEPPHLGLVPVIEVGGDELGFEREATRAESLPALDLEHLEDMCMGVASLRDQLLDTFLSEIGPRLERLEESARLGDAQEVAREAHGLRGMLGTIGARAATELFAALETLGSSGDVSAAPRLLARAKVAAERARQAIEELPFRRKAA